jgi:hypothetical protein
LESRGGLLYPAYKMALMIRMLNIKTVVGADSECASACMLMYAAGIERHAGFGARLGVHNASDGSGSDSDDGTVDLAKDMALFGAPPSVVGKLVVTPSDSMTYLDNDDVAGWVQLHDPSTAYAQPDNPQPQQEQTTEAISMVCLGEAGTYTVTWTTEGLWFKDKWHAIEDAHQHPKTTAYVLNGKTRWGTYGAVFGGPNPRMEFSNGRDVVKDHCQ